VKHLKVRRTDAETARARLERERLLHPDFRAQHDGEFVLWPLAGATEGEIVQREGLPARAVGRDYRDALSPELRALAPRAFDMLGHVGILRLSDEAEPHAAAIAQALLESHVNLRTVAVDSGVQGQWRVRSLVVVAGEESLVVQHRENGLRFEVDLQQVFFSPRLAAERARIAALVRPGERLLDAFAGVGPFAISAARAGAQAVAVDGNPAAERWVRRNCEFNSISSGSFEFHTGLAEELVPGLGSFDRVIVNHPTGSLDFAAVGLAALASGGVLHLYLLADRKAPELPPGVAEVMGDFASIRGSRMVHPYSPGRELRVLDIRREDS
jgi:tRNA (guanine37-N1)-methyltransferase